MVDGKSSNSDTTNICGYNGKSTIPIPDKRLTISRSRGSEGEKSSRFEVSMDGFLFVDLGSLCFFVRTEVKSSDMVRSFLNIRVFSFLSICWGGGKGYQYDDGVILCCSCPCF